MSLFNFPTLMLHVCGHHVYVGGWNLVGIVGNVSQWNVNNTQFVDEKIAGSPAFFSLYVDVDDKNSSVYVLQVLCAIMLCIF